MHGAYGACWLVSFLEHGWEANDQLTLREEHRMNAPFTKVSNGL